ncbi:hypothetical protein IMY05_002G0148300 [Salix suchowensis]|nr:hypothetical protein IMY05_002G0148300 [Salix suchowensis]
MKERERVSLTKHQNLVAVNLKVKMNEVLLVVEFGAIITNYTSETACSNQKLRIVYRSDISKHFPIKDVSGCVMAVCSCYAARFAL